MRGASATPLTRGGARGWRGSFGTRRGRAEHARLPWFDEGTRQACAAPLVRGVDERSKRDFLDTRRGRAEHAGFL